MTPREQVIAPFSGKTSIDWGELYRYRDMFRFFTLRSIKARYAQSVVGIGWAVIQPVFSMVVFTIVFGRLAKVQSDGQPYAVFAFAALVPWTYFSNAVGESTTALIANAAMLSKVYFPRLILPLTVVTAKLVDFVIAFILLVIMLAFYGIVPGRGVLVIPLLVIIMILAALGVGLWLTALAIQYRDVSYASSFLLQLLMYAAPVVYPTNLIPPRFRLIYALNPMVGVIEGTRAALFGSASIPWAMIGIGSVTAVLLTWSGALYFRRKERVFADVA